MNEQIIITRNNTGVEVYVQFVDNKKKPIDITEDTVEISIKDPGGNITEVEGYHIDGLNGVSGFILESDNTSTEGLWSMYWSLVNESGFVTAQEAIYYFVIPENGGE